MGFETTGVEIVLEEKGGFVRDTTVGHLPKGTISRFANTIFFLLRTDESSSCEAVAKGNLYYNKTCPF